MSSGATRGIRIPGVREYYRDVGVRDSRQWLTTSIVVCVYLALQVAIILVFAPATGLPSAVLDPIVTAYLLGFGVVAAWFGWLIHRNLDRQVRAWRHATAHGLRYRDRDAVALRPASAAPGAQQHPATDVVHGDGFAAGSFRRRAALVTRRAAFLTLSLPSEVPPLVLANRRVGVLAGSDHRVVRGQRLRLEGDFDRTFALHVAAGFERDALQIFTPDLMAAMLDLASDFEVELAGRTAVLYRARRWRLWRPAEFDAMLELVAVLGGRLQRRTLRYRATTPITRLRLRPAAGTVAAIAAPLLLTGIGIAAQLLR